MTSITQVSDVDGKSMTVNLNIEGQLSTLLLPTNIQLQTWIAQSVSKHIKASQAFTAYSITLDLRKDGNGDYGSSKYYIPHAPHTAQDYGLDVSVQDFVHNFLMVHPDIQTNFDVVNDWRWWGDPVDGNFANGYLCVPKVAKPQTDFGIDAMPSEAQIVGEPDDVVLSLPATAATFYDEQSTSPDVKPPKIVWSKWVSEEDVEDAVIGDMISDAILNEKDEENN